MTRFLIRKEPHFSIRYLTLASHLPHILAGSSTRLRLQFFWARNAIYHALRFLGVPPNSKVLLPAYLCKAAIQPIEVFGAEPIFYAVHHDCTPDLTDLESKIDNRTRVVMAVHHFGFPRGIHDLRQLCDLHGLFLLEDCAHVLQVDAAGQPLGTFGDASVFSWRKFLPVYDGGELLINREAIRASLHVDWQSESWLFTLKATKNLIEELLPHAPHELSVKEEAVPSESGSRPESAVDFETPPLRLDRNSSTFAWTNVNFPMSRISRLLWPHFSLAKLAARRRDNYLGLRARLSSIEGVRSLDQELPAGIVPWMLPVFIGDLPNAHASLRQIGIPAVTWGGVRHPRISAQEFPDAHFLYENLVFLPIHQDLDEKALDLIAEAVKRVRRPTRSTVSVNSPGS